MDYNFVKNLKPKDAIKIQEILRDQISLESLDISKIKFIAGADISLNMYSDIAYAGFVILSFPEMKVISYSMVKSKVAFPYIPGLLSFREIPALLDAWDQLELKPDLVIMDGQGIAHPRRVGIATHFSMLTNVPSIGCAKNKLTGTHSKIGIEQGKYKYLYDGEEKIGFALRSKTNTKPVFVSPGSLIDIETSLQIMLQCLGKYRIPEPTRNAHNYVNMFRRGELKEGYHEY